MIKKLNPQVVHVALKKLLEKNTKDVVLDMVPLNQEAPFYCVELLSIEPADTKTMFRDKYIFLVHAIAEGDSSTKIYKMIHAAEEALTEKISLPEECELIPQRSNGLRNKYVEETGEVHAVLEYEFTVLYGYRMK